MTTLPKKGSKSGWFTTPEQIIDFPFESRNIWRKFCIFQCLVAEKSTKFPRNWLTIVFDAFQVSHVTSLLNNYIVSVCLDGGLSKAPQPQPTQLCSVVFVLTAAMIVRFFPYRRFLNSTCYTSRECNFCAGRARNHVPPYCVDVSTHVISGCVCNCVVVYMWHERRKVDHKITTSGYAKIEEGGDLGESCADWSWLKYVTDGFRIEGEMLLSEVLMFENVIKLCSNIVNFILT